MNLKTFICSYPDFPKPGVQFWDFSRLVASPAAFKQAIKNIKEKFQHFNITDIAAIEAKGFTLGAMLAYEMCLPLTLIRKPGLIPGDVMKRAFVKEYGQGEYQLKQKSFTQKSQVLIVYDILAGVGATDAAIKLVEDQGAKVAGCAYVIELEYLNGRKRLTNYELYSLVKIAEKSQTEMLL